MEQTQESYLGTRLVSQNSGRTPTSECPATNPPAVAADGHPVQHNFRAKYLIDLSTNNFGKGLENVLVRRESLARQIRSSLTTMQRLTVDLLDAIFGLWVDDIAVETTRELRTLCRSFAQSHDMRLRDGAARRSFATPSTVFLPPTFRIPTRQYPPQRPYRHRTPVRIRVGGNRPLDACPLRHPGQRAGNCH